MSLLNRYGGYVEWLSSAMSCCAPQMEERSRIERPMAILHHQQPRLIPPPIPEPQYAVSRTKSISSRVSFSVRRNLNAYNGPRRPHISAPTDFRHVEVAIPRRTERFRPLELSIYMPDNRLSAILPHFEEAVQSILSYPPAVLVHTRSESAMSNFTIKRKPLSQTSMSMTRKSIDWVQQPLRPRPSLSSEELMAIQIPPKARLRAISEPYQGASEQLERVRSAYHEKEELQRQLMEIDSIIVQRTSLYMSRPRSSCRRRSESIYESEEPMPNVTTPVTTPQPDVRPTTPPARQTVHIPVRAKSFTEASAAFTQEATSTELLSPPLPLVLQSRPPLRKKKSFSRVSNWLFPEHARNISLDSVTNMPKPVTARDGFYQCVDPGVNFQMSTESVSTIETMDSDNDTTVPTTYTPESSPRGKAELTRVATFGEKEMDLEIPMEAGQGCRISRVGVAF